MSSYFGQIEIINKKTVGKKLLYLVVSDSMKKWIDYDQLTSYLPQVIEYEKKQSLMYSSKKYQKSPKEKFVEEKIQQSTYQAIVCEEGTKQKSNIKYLEFIDIVGYDNETREKVILFKAFLNNGKSDYLTNTQIKTIDMGALVKFYESQIKNTRF